MALSIEDVHHVASLARLSLTLAEEKQYQSQLSAILDAIAALSELNTDHVEPTSHASVSESIEREDIPHVSLDPLKGLANAPKRVGTSFAVPNIME